ncbi:hypothetical protein C7C46_23845 [Streptomyces tateyamensis]|uniref:Uncharacterized protein n=1 Tax=Streptomyces tateyamensis TaxID=565073 RepID=A0A2V4N8N3_9ACTN|nr:hypothetical protein [Streptomyces tateyamensis]PYC74558.1 hypothetical protein C7C46_23845 [Streptomyces tateyamensis]
MSGESEFTQALASNRRIPFLVSLVHELTMAERGSYRDRTEEAESALRTVGFLNELRMVILNQLRADTFGADTGYPDAALAEVLLERVERAGMTEFWDRTTARAVNSLG